MTVMKETHYSICSSGEIKTLVPNCPQIQLKSWNPSFVLHMCVESATEISLTFPSKTSAIRRLKVSRLEYDVLRLDLALSNITFALNASARSIFLIFENCCAVSAELVEK